MYKLDQQNIVLSQQTALVPGAEMIDARTDRDRLWFLSSFAALINYYNSGNKREGNWMPFLLKDPVLLLNNISKTDYDHLYKLYTDISISIRQKLNIPDEVWTATEKPRALAASDSSLFTPSVIIQLIMLLDILERVLASISEWTYYMQLNDETYPLKTYVISLVASEFSSLQRSFNVLRKQLYSKLPSATAKEIPAQTNTRFYKTELWESNRGNNAWWSVLDIQVDPVLLQVMPWPVAVFDKIRVKGDELFNFYKTIITEAGPACDIMSMKKSRYPDTTLLRAFVSLLQVQQGQLNTLTDKHLSFYYRDILRQRLLTASPDTAFLCAGLLAPDAVFKLPAGTAFDAGTDQDFNPILFTTTNEEILNPALLTDVLTLGFEKNGGPLSLEAKANVNTLQYDANGLLKSWKTFGGKGKAVKMGFSFGSPLLFLSGGKRTVVIRIKFSQLYSHAILDGALYSLSTKAGWLALSDPDDLKVEIRDVIIPDSLFPSYTEATITITLEAGVPAIETMDENPDGVNSAWPMFKIFFNSITNRETPPFIQWITVEVDVKELTNVQLLSNDGLLSNKAPFTPFGSLPVQNSNFIIGSNEIFSKPFSGLTIKLWWDNLPANLQTYYQAYNDNLVPSACPPGSSKKNPDQTTPPTKKKNFFSRLWSGIKSLFGVKQKDKEEEPGPLPANQPFNNCVFQTVFSFLQQGSWMPLALVAPPHYVTGSGSTAQKSCLPKGCDPSINNKGEELFRVICDSETLVNLSVFELPPQTKTGFIPDPSLQQLPLEFSDESQSGFMRLTLSGPSEGFGFALYPIVISNIALKNACTIARQNSDVLLPPPNPPLVPAASLFTVTYQASASYDLCAQTEGYPLQCFLYTPFTAYKIYDNDPAGTVKSPASLIAIDGPVIDPDGTPVYPCGVPLYPVFPYKGSLLLSFTQLISGQPLNLFFAFAATTDNIDPEKKVTCNYLSSTGWKPLPVLDDNTRNLNCTGIIRFNIPGDITDTSPLMTGNKYWISLATRDELSVYPQVVYLNTNGFSVKRSGDRFLSMQQTPVIAAGTIVQAFTPVPELATVVQPFISFGGRPAENQLMMNNRVSNRIKTKDRAVTITDYYTLVTEQFSFVYYVNPVREWSGGITVYVVKKAMNFEMADAFSPFISTCEAAAIQQYLADKVQGTLAAGDTDGMLYVRNPEPVYIRVHIHITLQNGYEDARMKPLINKVISIYLSPWISTHQSQTAIGQPLHEAGIANCVNGVTGVKAVTKVSFTKTITPDEADCGDTSDAGTADVHADELFLSAPQQLFVSVQSHCIQFNHAA